MKKFVFILFACCVFQINAQEIKEMQPTLGRLLDFDPKIGADFEKAYKMMDDINWDNSLISDEQKRFFKQIGFDYEDEMTFLQGYWDAIDGGCNWWESGGADTVIASSSLKATKGIDYIGKNAQDYSYKTAWVEGVKGYGIGEYLTYYFRPKAPRITKIIIANGYVKSPKNWLENSRVKKLKMYIDDKPFAILNLEDCRREQIFELEKPIGKPRPEVINGDWKKYNEEWEKMDELPQWTLKLEILEVYKGDKYDDTAITELYFDGIDVHCFAAGTKILMADNSLKNIELVKKGDFVKSYDFRNKKLVNSKVTKLISAKHDNLLKLKFADNEIITTADHSFFTDKNAWAAVNAEKANSDYFQSQKIEKLNAGDKIFIPQKNTFSKLMSIENVDNQQITYTLELSENDNFIANGLLVKMEIIK